jgi:hypothetical protein
VSDLVTENLIVYKPVTPTFDDEAHVLEAPGIRYEPQGPKYPPNIIVVVRMVLMRNIMSVWALFHKIIVCVETVELVSG